MSTTETPAFIVRTSVGSEEFASSADAVSAFDKLSAEGAKVALLHRDWDNPEAEDDDRGEFATDLIRTTSDSIHRIALPEAALHLMLDALRNYKIDVEELDGFEPWKNYDSPRDEDQLASEAGTSHLISETFAAIRTALDGAPGDKGDAPLGH